MVCVCCGLSVEQYKKFGHVRSCVWWKDTTAEKRFPQQMAECLSKLKPPTKAKQEPSYDPYRAEFYKHGDD